MTHTEIVKKLIGNINPVGKTETDDERFENLKQTCNLVSELLYDISIVSLKKDRGEFSIKRAGQYASDFLKGIG